MIVKVFENTARNNTGFDNRVSGHVGRSAVEAQGDWRHLVEIPELSAPDLRVRGRADQSISRLGFGLALGYFDGVHRGHQILIDQLILACRTEGLSPAVYTFDILPKPILAIGRGAAAAHLEQRTNPERPLPGNISQRSLEMRAELLRKWGLRIQTAGTRADFLAELGVHYVFEHLFNDSFKNLSPEAFLERLCEDVPCRLIVVGDDFRFGRERSGDAAFLQSWGDKHGIRVIVVPQVKRSGDRISSTAIRHLLLDGRLESAQALMGHPFVVQGRVIHGRALGRSIGMPTANMRLYPEQILLPFGVYASRCRVGERYYDSISNIGLRPTVDRDEKEPLLETFLFDFTGDLYGQELDVYLLRYMRPECTFDHLDAMAEAVKTDIETCRAYFAGRERIVPFGRRAGIGYYHMPSVRFTQAQLMLEIKIPSDRQGNAARALAQRIVMQASEVYPDARRFNRMRDACYGANVDACCEREGNLQVLLFEIEACHRAPDGERPFRALAEAFFSHLTRTALDEQGLFQEQIFETERQNQILELQAQNQDKSRYAFNQAIQIALGSEPEACPAGGDPVTMAALDRETVTRAWFELLREAQINVFTAGDIDFDERLEIFEALEQFRAFGRDERQNAWPGLGLDLRPRGYCPEAKGLKIEYKDVQQGRLYMLLTGLPQYSLLSGAVMNVLNSLLGADSHSLLFETVREQSGFAYSIYSYPMIYISSLAVSAGIDAEKWQAALDQVREQLRCIAAGDFSESLYLRSRSMVTSKLKLLSDNLHAQLSYQIPSLEGRRLQDSVEAIQNLQSIERQDIVEMAGELRECLTYLLLPADLRPEYEGEELTEGEMDGEEARG